MDLLYRIGYRAAYRLLQAWWRLRSPQGRGAAIAAWDGDRLLVVRTSYRATFDLPGGGIEGAETALAAAVRELREETGIDAPADDLVDAGTFRFEENHRQITAQVFEWRPGSTIPPTADNREIIWAGYMSREQLHQQPQVALLALYLAASSSPRSAGTQVPSGTRQISRA